MSFKELLKISPKVARAFSENRPVVSLESTIISHGMPYPNNRKCAIEVEEILTEDEIEELAKDGSKARKVSRRDIPYVLAQKGYGSTTVAGTMICSALAGIDIFVTGGLGGVHRGFEHTMDVSADLRELGRTPVTVVSAGVKNILDIPRTLEYLETEGVPVVTYGSQYFPAFFAPSSGLESPMSFDNIEEIANMLLVRKKLALSNGVLVAVPNRDTKDSEMIERAIQQALNEAEEQHITGAATTPFLLKRVHALTEGASVRANISLVKHNAQVGA
jgi:pseudouridylate synthase